MTGRHDRQQRADALAAAGIVRSDVTPLAGATIFPACYAGRWPHLHFEVDEGYTVALPVPV